MNYNQFLNKGLVKFCKTGNFKKHIIQNIETIGQRKLAILGDESDTKLLLDVLKSLKSKGVKVPEIAFHVTIDQRISSKHEEIRFISDLKGMQKSIYVLICSASTDFEVDLANRAGLLSSAEKAAVSLRWMGFSDSDFCTLNHPFTMYSICSAFYKLINDFAENSEKSKSAKLAKKTHEKLMSYKNKHEGQRVFLVGYRGIKLDEFNAIMNDRTISYNGISDIFPKTPQRPLYYLLSDQDHYLGNGKYIEGMECFVTTDVNVFEAKFTKQPTYLNVLSENLVKELPALDIVRQNYTLKKIDDLYYMLQMAIFMGFKEIYIYGFNELYSSYLNELEESFVDDEGSVYAFPEQAKTVLKAVNDYAKSNDINIYSLCNKDLLDVFEHKEISDININKTKILM